jgi:hypothetical protein
VIRYECVKPFRGRDADKLRWTFDSWMGHTALLCDQIWQRTCDWYDEPFRPFHDTENAGVSVLLAGAARAGFLPFSEYWIEKTDADGESTYGRADLWFIAEAKAFSFEFKRAYDKSDAGKLSREMERADRDIFRVPKTEHDWGFAGLIAPLYDEWTSESTLLDFAEEVDCCFKVGADQKYSCYFYFNRRGRL